LRSTRRAPGSCGSARRRRLGRLALNASCPPGRVYGTSRSGGAAIGSSSCPGYLWHRASAASTHTPGGCRRAGRRSHPTGRGGRHIDAPCPRARVGRRHPRPVSQMCVTIQHRGRVAAVVPRWIVAIVVVVPVWVVPAVVPAIVPIVVPPIGGPTVVVAGSPIPPIPVVGVRVVVWSPAPVESDAETPRRIVGGTTVVRDLRG